MSQKCEIGVACLPSLDSSPSLPCGDLPVGALVYPDLVAAAEGPETVATQAFGRPYRRASQKTIMGAPLF